MAWLRAIGAENRARTSKFYLVDIPNWVDNIETSFRMFMSAIGDQGMKGVYTRVDNGERHYRISFRATDA